LKAVVIRPSKAVLFVEVEFGYFFLSKGGALQSPEPRPALMCTRPARQPRKLRA